MTWDKVTANFCRDLDNMSPSTRWIRLQHPYAHNGIPLVYNGTIPDDDNFQEQTTLFIHAAVFKTKSQKTHPQEKDNEKRTLKKSTQITRSKRAMIELQDIIKKTVKGRID